MITEHYAMDVPKGVRIVAPATFAGQALAGGVVKDVRFNNAKGTVDLELTDGCTMPVPSDLRLTVDQDHPDRRARMAFANAVLAAADDMTEPCPHDTDGDGNCPKCIDGNGPHYCVNGRLHT